MNFSFSAVELRIGIEAQKYNEREKFLPFEVGVNPALPINRCFSFVEVHVS